MATGVCVLKKKTGEKNQKGPRKKKKMERKIPTKKRSRNERIQRKKNKFQKYLHDRGVVQSLIDSIAKMYEMEIWPENPVTYLVHALDNPEENDKLQEKIDAQRKVFFLHPLLRNQKEFFSCSLNSSLSFSILSFCLIKFFFKSETFLFFLNFFVFLIYYFFFFLERKSINCSANSRLSLRKTQNSCNNGYQNQQKRNMIRTLLLLVWS